MTGRLRSRRRRVVTGFLHFGGRGGSGLAVWCGHCGFLFRFRFLGAATDSTQHREIQYYAHCNDPFHVFGPFKEKRIVFQSL